MRSRDRNLGMDRAISRRDLLSGMGAAVAPGSHHINAVLDFPVSLGAYSFAETPDDPIAVQMECFPHRTNQGLTLCEQSRVGRREMLATSFETIERQRFWQAFIYIV